MIVGVVPRSVWVLVGILFALALATTLRSRLSGLRARRLERQRGQLLEDVGLLQAALLPLTPPRLGPVGTSAAYRPADGPGAGGDFYDIFALEDGRLAVIVGDVSGHGRQALPHTALLRFTLRAYLEAGLSPRAAVQTAGTVLDRQLGESFATVVAATYHPRERILTYACAGHPPPLVIGQGRRGPEDREPGPASGLGRGTRPAPDPASAVGSIAPVTDPASPVGSIVPVTVCSSPPIGAGMRTGVRQTTVSLPGQSLLCFYTDGVTEARVGSKLFGVGRLELALAELGSHATASGLLDRVVDATDRRPDDMAACLLDVTGGTAAPAVLTEELELDREGLASARPEKFLLACGVPREEIAELIGSARAAAGHAGTVILEVRPLHDRPPRVTLRRDNVARLRTPLAAPHAAIGGSQ